MNSDDKKKLSESDICDLFITPAIKNAGWDPIKQIRREVTLTPGPVVVRGSMSSRNKKKKKFADYVLSWEPGVPIGVVEAKDNTFSVSHGIQQALGYAEILEVPSAFSSNGDAFASHNKAPAAGENIETQFPLESFPAPADLWKRYKRGDYVYVDFVRDGSLAREGRAPPPGTRIGDSREFRLSERWTSSAKSVFQFDVQGSVAKSTHAGIPWLKRIREAVGDRVHFWPFDGWLPPAGKSVIAEVYPSIFRKRYPEADAVCQTADERDAYAVARWLAEMSGRGELGRYWEPPLSEAERVIAGREGWILGVV